MSEKLFEQNFMTFDLRTIGRLDPEVEETEEARENEATEEPAILDGLPNAGEWEKWGELLQERKEANNRLSSTLKKSEYEVESKFFEEFFSVNWGKTTGDRLNLFGAPLKKAITVLEFDPKKNPILGFITKPYVLQNLINTDKLNVETFKAIYNAVVKKLVAQSEFIRDYKEKDEYNLIYCLALYEKPVAEIEKYLELQKSILGDYSADKLILNRKAFFNIDGITKSDLEERAKDIINWANALPDVKDAKLNSLALAELISGKKITNTKRLTTKEQTALLSKLPQKTDLYAALLYLNISTESAKVKAALKNDKFNDMESNPVVIQKLIAIAKDNIIPKGQLDNTTADAIADQILAKLTELS